MIKFILLIAIAYGKFVSQSIKLTRFREWQYLTKFGGNVGNNNYEVKFRLIGAEHLENKQLEIRFEVHLDEEWEITSTLENCNVKQISNKKLEKARRSEPIILHTNGDWAIFTGHLVQHSRTHFWYFAYSDCNGNLKNGFTLADYKNIQLQAEINIKNSDDVEFSTELRGFLELLSVLTFFGLALLVYLSKQMLDRYTRYQEFSLPLFLILLTLSVEMLSYICNVIHLGVYSSNGKGLMALQVIATLLQFVAQFGLTMLLVLMSQGWSIRFVDFVNFELYIPMSVFLAFIQATILGIGFIDNDAHNKNYHYEGWVGWLASFIFLGEYVYFLVNLTAEKNNEKIKQFYLQLGIYGTLYFVSFPILQTVNLIVAPYLRHKVMEIGTMAFRTFAIVLLARLFTSKGSLYSSISYENQSFLDRGKYN